VLTLAVATSVVGNSWSGDDWCGGGRQWQQRCQRLAMVTVAMAPSV